MKILMLMNNKVVSVLPVDNDINVEDILTLCEKLAHWKNCKIRFDKAHIDTIELFLSCGIDGHLEFNRFNFFLLVD